MGAFCLVFFVRDALGAFSHVAFVLLPSDKFCIMMIKYIL
jgi:hypothetical protein